MEGVEKEWGKKKKKKKKWYLCGSRYKERVWKPLSPDNKPFPRKEGGADTVSSLQGTMKKNNLIFCKSCSTLQIIRVKFKHIPPPLILLYLLLLLFGIFGKKKEILKKKKRNRTQRGRG
eukprot:TRINITY_DN8929_c1_g1_i2.p1 TRINITY_DN8929_c1_g1~~TRINITY_DN8929_c1_g1_i2.p1  ORF type:complete len:119 (+),score=7.25 TRINITY_DN8929_c1_g1_i2:457-813(+)